jgi:hypothetical protein
MASLTKERVTTVLPKYLKNDSGFIKDELKTSMSAICKQAIPEYVEKNKHKKIHAEALTMVQEYEENPEMVELSNFKEDIYEYI